MKMLFCPACQDVQKLLPEIIRTCSCGRTSGRRSPEGKAEINGGLTLAFDNDELISAVSSMLEINEGARGSKGPFYVLPLSSNLPLSTKRRGNKRGEKK